jgi:DNA-binding response OmpR family regulator
VAAELPLSIFGSLCQHSESSTKQLLVVDDEEQDRFAAYGILCCESCTILGSNSYRDALSLFVSIREHVDLLVVDLSLPGGYGCDLALQMRELQPDLRVLFVSGLTGAHVCRYYGLDLTDVHFLTKPFTASQLSERVERVLNAAEPFPELHLKSGTS